MVALHIRFRNRVPETHWRVFPPPPAGPVVFDPSLRRARELVANRKR